MAVECVYSKSGYANFSDLNLNTLAKVNTLAYILRQQFLGGSDSFLCSAAAARDAGTLTLSVYIDPSIALSVDCFDYA